MGRNLCFIAFIFAVVVGVVVAGDDLYKLLGVSRTASTKEIKQAYRRKARDTHPDKNKGVPPEQAAEDFRKVVHAFEVLSDDSSRKHYDRTGKDSTTSSFGGGGGGRNGGGFGGGNQWSHFHFHWNYRSRPIKLKDKFEVQQAQSRVLHIVSLEQLQTVMLDDDELLERNLLMCVVTPGNIETHADDEMVFPYPFAAMSSQGIWWEDLLQTVKVRYNRENAFTRFFNLPNGDALRKEGKPLFLFWKKGQKLTPENMSRIQTSSRQEFEAWVWKQIEVPLRIVNKHPHPIEVYWVHETRAHDRGIIQPGESKDFITMLAHEWYIRDARVDTHEGAPGRYKLTTESSLGSWKIGVEAPSSTVLEDGTVEIVVETQHCYDLSGHCQFWKMIGECPKYEHFMKEACALTCGHCKRDKPSGSDEL